MDTNVRTSGTEGADVATLEKTLSIRRFGACVAIAIVTATFIALGDADPLTTARDLALLMAAVEYIASPFRPTIIRSRVVVENIHASPEDPEDDGTQSTTPAALN